LVPDQARQVFRAEARRRREELVSRKDAKAQRSRKFEIKSEFSKSEHEEVNR